MVWISHLFSQISQGFGYLLSGHRITTSSLPKACTSDDRIHSGNVDSCLQTSFKHQNNSTISCSTWPHLCCFSREWWGTPLGCCFFFHIPVDDRVDIARVVAPTSYMLDSSAGDEWGRQRVMRDVMQRKSKMKGWNTLALSCTGLFNNHHKALEFTVMP